MDTNMLDLLDKLVTSMIGQGANAFMLLIIGYLAWQNWNTKKDHKEELKEYKATLEKLQATLTAKTGEEREMLLSIIEKYHQSQIGIREAINEVKAVLSTIAALSQRGA
jgi:hypothetical protein